MFIVVEKVVLVEKKGLYDSLKVSDKRVPRKVRDNCKDPKDLIDEFLSNLRAVVMKNLNTDKGLRFLQISRQFESLIGLD